MNTQTIDITKSDIKEIVESSKPINPLTSKLTELEARIKKISDAQDFLEDIGDRLYWALDFSECKDATDPLNEIVEAVNKSQDKLEESRERLETVLEEFQEKKAISMQRLNNELCEALSSF